MPPVRSRPPALGPQPNAFRVIRYSVQPKNPAAHLFEVSVSIDTPDPAGQRFMLPVWIPGSYMVREFARHIVTLSAKSKSRRVACEKIDKHTWQCAPCKGPLTLTYEVYAWDLSVRAAHLDESHGFFNGTSLFLLPEGMQEAPCELHLQRPAGAGYASWRVATAMKPAERRGVSGKNASKRPPIKDFGVFVADNYDELIDHPVEMGTFTHASFEACGVPHHVVITGRHRADMNRLTADLRRVCEAQIRLFEPESGKAPMREYWFLIMAVGDGFGGLEHRASTALLVSRDDLPLVGLAEGGRASAGYRKFLSLASHEYFHTWNVKRIKPAAFVPYDLTRENYTRQLWFFEGITDYYDDLMLSRAGLISALEYLEIEADSIGRLMAQAGRTKQSVAESSFDAWIKYYRQDENAVNSIVSYYQKGGLVGLALDLTIRRATRNTKSLDDVMRTLWRDYGLTGHGVPEGEIEKVASHIAGTDLTRFFADYVYGTQDPDLANLFADMGITLSWRHAGNGNGAGDDSKRSESSVPGLGAKIVGDTNGDARLAQVFDGGSAMLAGLSAGDTIVAIDGLRVNVGNLEKRIRSYAVGSVVPIIAFRRDELLQRNLKLQAQTARTCVLTLSVVSATVTANRLKWLGQ